MRVGRQRGRKGRRAINGGFARNEKVNLLGGGVLTIFLGFGRRLQAGGFGASQRYQILAKARTTAQALQVDCGLGYVSCLTLASLYGAGDLLFIFFFRCLYLLLR